MAGNKRRGIIVQDRDRHLLRELGVMRVMDREQAKCVAPFGSTTRANVRLLALTRAGLLRRFFLGTSGRAKKSLYTLSQKGADLVNVPYRGLRRAKDEILVADFFVSHQLAVNDLYLIVKYRPIPVADASFVRWVSFPEPIEPGTQLIPDGYLEVRTSDRIIAAFLEVDLGHESRAVWRRKVQEYIRYAVSGKFRDRFGQPQFRTLVAADSARRVDSLRTATAAITDKIFWFTTLESIHREGFWSAIWDRPKGGQHQSLL